jgi:hypothetical protein
MEPLLQFLLQKLWTKTLNNKEWPPFQDFLPGNGGHSLCNKQDWNNIIPGGQTHGITSCSKFQMANKVDKFRPGWSAQIQQKEPKG